MGGTLMRQSFPKSADYGRFLLTCCTVALLSSPVFAQTNNTQAPVLPPPPNEALKPIEAPVAAAATTPATTTAAPAKPTETPSVNLGATQQQPTLTPVTTTPEVPQAAPVATTSTAVPPIALPGMPPTEAALSSAGTPQYTNTIDPSLIGGTNNPYGYDQAAYEMQLQQRLADIKTETRRRALEQAQENMFPMQADEIQDIIRRLRTTQSAIQKSIEVPPPTPRAVVHTMELDPGAVPPTIKMLNGNVTSLTILDASGQPWPIVDIAYGGTFDVKAPESNGHIIRISPLKEYARGNMSIRLQNLATPLTFTLESGGSEVHYRFDARIPQLGPNAKTPLIDRGIGLSAGGDAALSAILVGTPPAGAVRMKVTGVDGRTSAYAVGSSTYVRTPLTLLSPTWQSSASSADGTNVYVLGDVPVLLLSDNGVMVRAQLQKPYVDPLGLPAENNAIPGMLPNATGGRG
jgi:hypothetical protein